MAESNGYSDGSYQVVMDGHGAFSAPYVDRKQAEKSASEFEEEITDRTFHVETWPNHRQHETDTDNAEVSDT